MNIPSNAVVRQEVRGDTKMKRLPGFEKKDPEVVEGDSRKEFIQPVEDPSGA